MKEGRGPLRALSGFRLGVVVVELARGSPLRVVWCPEVSGGRRMLSGGRQTWGAAALPFQGTENRPQTHFWRKTLN